MNNDCHKILEFQFVIDTSYNITSHITFIHLHIFMVNMQLEIPQMVSVLLLLLLTLCWGHSRVSTGEAFRRLLMPSW